jgi:hypothetical protein
MGSIENNIGFNQEKVWFMYICWNRSNIFFIIHDNKEKTFFSIYKTDVVQAKLLITEPVKLSSSQTLSNMSVSSPKTFENNSEKPVPNWIKKRSLTESKGNDLDKNKKKPKFQL